MSAQAPGSVTFDEQERELIDEAALLLVTGWTHEQYMNTPLDVVDAVRQVHGARQEIQAWQVKRGR